MLRRCRGLSRPRHSLLDPLNRQESLIFWSQGELGFSDVEDLVGTCLLMLGAALGPAMGLWFFAKQGPLVIDPGAETLTYRRHVFPFDRLGLVRVGTATTLMPSVSSVESGVPGEAAPVKVAVVASGDFMLSPDDQLPRRRAEKLADHLNAVLAEYYDRNGEPVGPRRAMSR